MDVNKMDFDFSNAKNPSMASNPPMPYGAYKLMKEDARYEKITEEFQRNYDQLLELTQIKEKELEAAKVEAKKARRYNVVSLILSVMAILISIASWLLPNILEG